MTTQNQVTFDLRMMGDRDVRDMVAIEEECFPDPWTADDFRCALNNPRTIRVVAEYRLQTVAYIIVCVRRKRIEIINIAVTKGHRRQGIGSYLIKQAVAPVVYERRQEIGAIVRETNVSGQLFLKANGFICTEILAGHVAEDEAGYLFKLIWKGW